MQASEKTQVAEDNGSVEEELSAYLALPLTETELVAQPLQFWAKHRATFSKLAAMTRMVYSIPASSAQCERDFSLAGNTVNPKRTHVSPKRLEELELVHSAVLTKLVAPDFSFSIE